METPQRPGQRYDESTSAIAIGLGKLLNYSPKKLYYLIDQYSGIVGDLVLPLTTKKAERNVLALQLHDRPGAAKPLRVGLLRYPR